MANQRSGFPGSSNLGMLTELINRLRLVWLLLWDNRVALWAKAILPLSLIYLISPVDFIPDVIPGLTQLDDLGVILLGITLFVKLCPPEIVEGYRHQLEYGGNFDRQDDKVVDTTYRVVDED